MTRALVVAVLCAVLTYQYVSLIELGTFAERKDLHQQIIAGTAIAPYRYRVLVPYIAEGMSRALAIRLPPQASFQLAYGLLDVLTVTLCLGALYRYLCLWTSPGAALLALALFSALAQVGFRDHYFQPWSFLEAGVMALMLFYAARRRFVAMFVTAVVASLNRETGLFAILAAGFAVWPEGRRWIVGSIGAWAVIYAGLRVALGLTEYVSTVHGNFVANVTPNALLRMAVNVTLVAGLPAWLAYRARDVAPAFLRRALLVVPLYLAVVVIFSVWAEVRVLMTIAPILWPLAALQLERQIE
jgi:hypothetical protein